jgi:hypothetical protein
MNRGGRTDAEIADESQVRAPRVPRRLSTVQDMTDAGVLHGPQSSRRTGISADYFRSNNLAISPALHARSAQGQRARVDQQL